MASSPGYHGALVAFEGPPDVLSTQLRLLPTSPQISILPSIQSYLGASEEGELFDAKKYIKNVHDALQAREDIALTFLRDSTPDNKRLVFLNGGAPTALAMCIRAIAEHETGGDLSRAELVFNDLVRHGLAGLDKDFVEIKDDAASRQAHHAPEEDPIVRAMRAADALDRSTASLQPNTDVDLTLAARPRSMSLPMYSFDDNFGDAAPFYVFGTQNGSAADDDDEGMSSMTPLTVMTPRFAVVDYDRQPNNAEDSGSLNTSVPPDHVDYPPVSPSCIGESYGPLASPGPNRTLDLFSPDTEVFTPRAAETVEFRRASVVHVKGPVDKILHRRTRSLDRLDRASTQRRDAALRIQSRWTAKDEAGGPTDGRRYSCMTTVDMRPNEPVPPMPLAFDDTTRTVYVKADQQRRPAITLSPAPPKSRKRQRPSAYVDRGTDAEVMPEPEVPFQPVLPSTEDLIISFKDAAADFLLDSVIQSFKEDVYPVKPPTAISEPSVAEDGLSIPGTPNSQSTMIMPDTEPKIREFTPTKSPDGDEYDPFAYHSDFLKPAMQPVHIAQAIKTPSRPSPPSPNRTPPPPELVCASDDKFHDCDITNSKTAVAKQNDLRSVLNIYFPPEDKGYHHFHFSLLPEMGGLWKPVFREADSDSLRGNSRKIDQILAIGAQKGVKKAFVSGITGQLEDLGNKAGEVSRAGRLDFRYLVANAMQAYTTQPLANQTHDNPFDNSYLLATLIIPHLETYFVIHNEVRFLLLEYSQDHLATILALQKLVRVDLMKIAQVVDSNAEDVMPFTHVRGASIGRKESSEGRSISPPLNKRSSQNFSPEKVSMSKANFLLTSSATDADIGTFVSTIRKLLVEVSKFYVTEDPPKPTPKSKNIPPPIHSSYAAFPRGSGLQSPPLSPPPQSPLPPVKRMLPPRPPSPVSSIKAPSVTETIKTTRTNKSTRSRRPKSRKSDKVMGDVASLFTLNLDDDSDYDMEERRLMPIFMKKPAVRNNDSRKALKFLGLA